MPARICRALAEFVEIVNDYEGPFKVDDAYTAPRYQGSMHAPVHNALHPIAYDADGDSYLTDDAIEFVVDRIRHRR